MAELNLIFQSIEETLNNGYENEFFERILINKTNENKSKSIEETFDSLKNYIIKIIKDIDKLINILNNSDNILISVKHQKTLRTCFQLVASLGISKCLIPGLGLNLSQRCVMAQSLKQIDLNDDQKYDLLVLCTDFFYRSYAVPVLKNIILTFHLTDYLGALIQLAYAPLKKPGIYKKFTMTEEKYCKLMSERKTYISIYEHLVNNCFQPILMKELLVLQNVREVEPPTFVKRIIAKEMSRQLISPGGLLSLIRCFIDSHDMDVGVDWNKIHMITKIVSTKHGNVTESEYLNIMCGQLKQILNLNSRHYLATAVSCLINLSNKYPDFEHVKNLLNETLQPFNYEYLIGLNNNPGTIILTAQEVEHKIYILQICNCMPKLDIPKHVFASNLFVLCLMSLKCAHSETKKKINDVILKSLELEEKDVILNALNKLLDDDFNIDETHVLVEDYQSGVVLKCSSDPINYSIQDVTSLILFLFENTNKSSSLILYEYLLQKFLDQNTKRKGNLNETLLTLEDEPILRNSDEKYASILILLSEISASPKASIITTNPLILINFVEKLLLLDFAETDECITIALVLLNSLLANSNNAENIKGDLTNILPMLKKIAKTEGHNGMLCKEILSIVNYGHHSETESPYAKAINNIFDSLLPVRAHGIIELNKLIDAKDEETISKRHYVYCLLQNQLKDSDSYVYLAAINCTASLAKYCTEDVLNALCKEFLQSSLTVEQTFEEQNKLSEMRMKIGDIIVKVTRSLGEMAVVHKTLLLNTFLCGCREDDPLIRTSALSNLAEIVSVLHYKVGTIIYEILLCIWNIIETDKAIECRRAAVMIITSFFKGLGKNTLIELKENLLPIYRTLNKLYKNENEDSIVRLHAQLAIEELNDIVKEFLFAEIPMEKQFYIKNEETEIKFK